MKFTDTDALKSLVESVIGASVTSLSGVDDPGAVNDVFIMSTNDSQLIVRLNKSHELSRFEKEKWCIKKAKSVGVSVPAVIAVGETANYAYLLESYIQGTRADQLKDPSLVWSSIGQYAKAIHGIKVSGFGESLENIMQGSHDEWDNYLKDNLQTLEAKEKAFIDSSGLTSSEVEAILIWLQDLKDKDLQFGLSHGDLSLKNAIVSENGEVNLIDWGAAEAHAVPHYDLGVILEDSLGDDSEYFHCVLQGYGMSYDEYLGIKPDILTVMLLIAVDKLRWAIDRRPELTAQMTAQLRHRYEARKLIEKSPK